MHRKHRNIGDQMESPRHGKKQVRVCGRACVSAYWLVVQECPAVRCGGEGRGRVQLCHCCRYCSFAVLLLLMSWACFLRVMALVLDALAF